MGFFKDRPRRSPAGPPTRRDIALGNARYGEERRDWWWAARNYLEAGLPGDALTAIRKIGKDSSCPIFDEDIQRLKQYGILEEAVEHLTAVKDDATLPSLGNSLIALAEYNLAGAAYLKWASSGGHKYDYQTAAEAFARGGKKDVATDCLLKRYDDGKDIHYGDLHAIHEMGLLNEFIERVVNDKTVAIKLMEAVAQWSRCPDAKYSTSLAAWKQHGGLNSFLDRMLAIDPIAPGRAVHRYGPWKSDPDCLLQCYQVAIERPSLTAEEKEEVSKWGASLAEHFQRRGDYGKAASLWSEVGGYTAYLNGVRCFVEMGNYQDAASLCERLAKDYARGVVVRTYGSRAASLYARAGRHQRAAEMYRLAGRPAKAERLSGPRRYDPSEMEWFVTGDMDDVVRTFRSRKKPDEWTKRFQSLQELVESVLERLGDPGVALLSSLDGLKWLAQSGKTSEGEGLRRMESVFRAHGFGFYGAALWVAVGNYDEFDRVCQEEDELEVAALWYEREGLPDRTARIYEMMSRQPGAGPAKSTEVESETLTCSCGQRLESSWVVCPRCERPLGPVCACGQSLESDWKRCPVCGAKVTN